MFLLKTRSFAVSDLEQPNSARSLEGESLCGVTIAGTPY
jgi:hypothetical protein